MKAVQAKDGTTVDFSRLRVVSKTQEQSSAAVLQAKIHHQ